MSTSQLDQSPSPRPISTRGRLRARLGGAEGNEILTSADAIVLTVLLVAEGITVLNIHGLASVHMFIGMVLVPPVALKLGSTGYRFARYYTRARPYRQMGPPLLGLRLLAPVLVASTIALFTSGVVLLAAGRKSNPVFEIHKLSFVVWGVVFVPHLVAYLPRVVRSLRSDWTEARREDVPGSGLRAMLVAAALGGGAAIAMSLLPAIDVWQQ
jgi:hypothetical protein